jgi:citrate lyase subunit beta / citryl-CoA lyase
MPIRPRRSVLYMPGSNARALEKAKTLPADGLIFDLEDAVASDAKEAARAQVVAALQDRNYGRRELIVRINGLDTPWGIDDLDAVAKARPDAILVPKISAPADVTRASEQIDKRDAEHKLALWLMIETPLAILNVKELAASAKAVASRLACFVMGTNDLAKELHAAAHATRDPLLMALGMAVMAARAYGVTILDGVFNSVQDAEGFAAECRQGAQLGFDGKTLIHPSQIEPCNRIFAPNAQEVGWARKVIAAFEEAENASKGAIQLDGRMVERLHAEEAKRLVALADAIAQAEAAG